MSTISAEAVSMDDRSEARPPGAPRTTATGSWTRVTVLLLMVVIVNLGIAYSMLPGPSAAGDSAGAPAAAQPSAGVPAKPGPAPRPAKNEGPERSAPALALTFRSLTATPIEDSRTARLVALYVPAGEAPSPFLPVGAFTATWEGAIAMDVWDNITFSAEGSGAFKLTVFEKTGTERVVLDVEGADLNTKVGKLKLEKGANRFVATYTSPKQGDAWVRLFWAADEMPREPLRPLVLSHNDNVEALQNGLRLRDGAELLATLRCSKCHQQPELAQAAAATPLSAMPELAIDAPDLREAGARLRPEWITAWVRDPRKLRANATMPHLLRGRSDAELDADAANIAAYLASLDGGKPAGDLAKDDAATANGGVLFARMGCMACHAASGDQPAYVDLKYVKAKFKPAALADFIKQPNRHYAWVRMPVFRFTDEQAKQIASFLLTWKQEELPKPGAAGDAGKGKALVAASGCMNCHQVEGTNTFAAPALKAVAAKSSAGCLEADDAGRGKAPDFSLKPEQLAALRAILATDLGSLQHSSRTEFAARRVAALRCNACHERDINDAVFSGMREDATALVGDLPAGADAEESDKVNKTFDQPRPALTWIGEKLRPEWAAKFIAGEVKYRLRPYLFMRMPGFPMHADLLAQGLAMEHGFPPVTPADKPVDAGLAAFGKTFVTMDGGFNCIQCHDIGAQKATAVFEAPGINLAYAHLRLHHEYFHRWVRAPQRIDPTSKMTQFVAPDGTTALKEALGGKAYDQFEAIWNYLRTEEANAPAGDAPDAAPGEH